MKSTATACYVSAAAATAAAIAAIAVNRFKNVGAGTVALIAGIVPWTFCLAWYYLSNANVILTVSMCGSAPLFLIAIFLYAARQRTRELEFEAGASIVGMFAGGAFTMMVGDLLSQIG